MQDLTLQKAMNTVRTHEMVEKQQGMQLRETCDQKADVNRVYSRSQHSQEKNNFSSSKPQKIPERDWRDGHCRQCGASPYHDRLSCPARSAKCEKCSYIGHFEKFCRTKVENTDQKRQYNRHNQSTDQRRQNDQNNAGCIQFARIDSDSDSEFLEDYYHVSRAQRHSSSDLVDGYIGRIKRITRKVQSIKTNNDYNFACKMGKIIVSCRLIVEQTRQ